MKNFIFPTFISITVAMSLNFAQAASSEEIMAIDNLNVQDIRSTLYTAPTHGLDLSDYWNQSLEAQYQSNPADPRVWYQAKNSYVKFLRHLNAGTVNPESLGKFYLIRQRKFFTAKELQKLSLESQNDALNLASKIAPRTPHYRSLQEGLRRMSNMCFQNQWGLVPPLKRSLKLGDRDPNLVPIKSRLQQFGYPITNLDPVFDQQTLVAINNIQFVLHRKPDGIISPNGGTWKYLNVSCYERINQFKADLEKLRWFPREFGDRYMYVNLAHSYLTLIDRNQNMSTLMKVIAGREKRQTPTLADRITYITMNPHWVVPPTIFKEDKLNDLRGLSPSQVESYFEKNNYEVWDDSFKYRLSPGSINWDAVTSKTGIYIRQKPGLHNALGVLKFNLTNGDAIYLHDTNQRELFGEYERQLSSGCVRVERPFELAEYLLKGTSYSRDEIERRTAKPGEVPEKSENVTTPNPIPVYMVYQTSTMNSDMVMRFAEDHYRQAGLIQSTKTLESSFQFPGLF